LPKVLKMFVACWHLFVFVCMCFISGVLINKYDTFMDLFNFSFFSSNGKDFVVNSCFCAFSRKVKHTLWLILFASISFSELSLVLLHQLNTLQLSYERYQNLNLVRVPYWIHFINDKKQIIKILKILLTIVS